MRPRRLFVVVVWAVAGAAIGLVGATFVTRPLGYRTMTVMSGSMTPAIRTGDVVFTQRVSPLRLELRDVVTFRSPDTPGRLITHRVRKIRVTGHMVNVTTRGDANNTSEHWSVPTTGTVGLVRVRVPKVGYLLARIGNGYGRLLFFVLPVALLGISEIRRIWTWEPAGERRFLPIPYVPVRRRTPITHYVLVSRDGRRIILLRPAARMMVNLLARRTVFGPLPAFDAERAQVVAARLSRRLEKLNVLLGVLGVAIHDARATLDACGRDAVRPAPRELERVG